MTWENLFWNKDRFLVHSSKIKHVEGKAFRLVPLFPQLEACLMQAL